MPRKNVGPGPAKYLLPPSIGYNGHDFSRKRNPCYSIGTKCPYGTRPVGPGPAYLTANMTRRGIYSCPAYSMKIKARDLTILKPPGPGAYAPELVPPMTTTRPPEYSVRVRTNPPKPTVTPGPGTISFYLYNRAKPSNTILFVCNRSCINYKTLSCFKYI